MFNFPVLPLSYSFVWKVQNVQTWLWHASTCLVKQFIVPSQNQHGKDDIFGSELLAAVAYRDSGPAEWSPCNASRRGPRVHGAVGSQVQTDVYRPVDSDCLPQTLPPVQATCSVVPHHW